MMEQKYWRGTCTIFWFIWFAGNCFLCLAEKRLPPRITRQVPPDEILFQVASNTNENDKPFIMECEADGDPPPMYYWIKNGEEFSWRMYDDRISQQAGRGSLMITKPRDEDAGQYQCFARNKWGTATSNSVFVRITELNNFKQQRTLSVKAKEGEPLQLVCHPPDGWPKPNVNWIIEAYGSIRSIDSSRITVDPEGNLWFSNVTRQDASDDFAYACTAYSVFKNDYKIGDRIVLQVESSGVSPGQNKREPVQQYVTRRQKIALRDNKVQLFCIFGGTPLPQTVWFKNGRPLPVSDRISEDNYGKSLIIKHVTYEDEGDYTCQVSNGVGNAKSYLISLKVQSAPYFTEEPEIVNEAEGESAVIRCNAFGVPEPQIQWIYNGKHIASAPPNGRRTVSTNAVTIDKLEKSDVGNYGCNATNRFGYVYKDVYVNVLAAMEPEIREPPRDEESVDGRDVTLLCRVYGIPRPEVKWLRNGIELTGGRYTVQQNGDLLIRDVAFTDIGQYTCNARNKLGNVSAVGNLTVKSKTKIAKGLEPKYYEVKAGTPATFRCTVETDRTLDLEVRWLRNGQMIDLESKPRFLRPDDYFLTITNTIELDSGVYTCLARTRLDEATAQATLIVQDVPNVPKLLNVACNLKDASLTWQSMGDNRAPILNYIVQYNTDFTKDIWDTAFDSIPAADTLYVVPVSPWANYTFRVLAENKVGVSLPSSHSSVCKTEPDIPYENPSNVEVKGTRPDKVVITWTPMPEIKHNAPGFHYRVSWKRDAPGSNWVTEDVSDWRVGRKEISNQPTFQPYVVKVAAVNERGLAYVPPTEMYGYLGEHAPTEAPTNLTLK